MEPERPPIGAYVKVTAIPGVMFAATRREITRTNPVHGFVSSWDTTDDKFRFLPDEPDPTTNGEGGARIFRPDGWHVRNDNWEYAVLIIEEEETLAEALGGS